MTRIVLGMLTVTLCASVMWTARAIQVTPRRPHPAAAYRQLELSDPLSIDDVAPPPMRGADKEERQDLYGNGVSSAVATYTYDRAGTVYEEHSPQTEVPRLKPPIS